MQSENEAEGPDTDGGGRCPICRNAKPAPGCEHQLGVFDRTFPDEGEYGIGLLGGTLYGVTEIREVFNAARFDYAKARIRGEGRTAAVPAWCNEVPALKAYVESVGAIDEDLDPADYAEAPEDADVNQYADSLEDGGSDPVLVLTSLLEGVGIRVLETTWEQDIPMASSIYEEWWCEYPEDAAAKLTNRLRQILDGRAKSRA